MKSFKSALNAALQLELPYPERLPRKTGTPAAVLALFGIKSGQNSLLLIRRTEKVETHKGQMAFPGGVCEADELRGPDGDVRAALRETWEEIGIPPEQIEIVGRLPDLWTVTGFSIYPVVGLLRSPVEDLVLKLNPDEIDEGIWIPLQIFMQPATYRRELKRVGQVDYPIHVFQVEQYRIWGATGSMIRNLLDRLIEVGSDL